MSNENTKTELSQRPEVRSSRLLGCDLITTERCRQIEAEGWSLSHDIDEHDEGQLLEAATAYIRAAVNCGNAMSYRNNEPPECWPWAREWWKPSDSVQRNLVKAGALIAAEIDRRSSPLTAS
jgi:hypothetical protein